jgi:sugar/nucleoside kinase (ribokinase family)
VDTGHAPERHRGEQPVSVILVDQPTGLRSILYTLGGMPELAPNEVPAGLIRSARALHLDGGHLEAARRAAEIAREAGVVVSFDGGAGEPWPEVESLLPLVDVLVVASRFAQQHSGESDPLAAGPALLGRFQPRQVVITDGVRGCWYWDADQQFHQPAFCTEVIDTTGAGDVFHGAYLVALLEGWPPQKCLAFASATAALKCKEVGGRAGIPDRPQVEVFLANEGQ